MTSERERRRWEYAGAVAVLDAIADAVDDGCSQNLETLAREVVNDRRRLMEQADREEYSRLGGVTQRQEQKQ